MATKGNISDLDVLMFGGSAMVPLVSGFNRRRKTGSIFSNTQGGASRVRKKYHNTPHLANASFYLRSVQQQDFIQSFINRNEGRKFICHLSADRPVVEPYVVQVIGEWNHTEVNAVEGTVNCQLEIFSTSDKCLDEFLYQTYSCMGDNLTAIMCATSEAVENIPKNDT